VNPPDARDPLRHAPVFLLAPARSYSSVVGTMLGEHPDLYGFPELTMFEAATVGERLDGQPLIKAEREEWNPTAGLERALALLDGGSQDATSVASARAWLEARRSWRGEHVLDHLFERVAPLVPVEKSPGTVGEEQSLQRLAAAYPRARLLHLTRHPVTTAWSMQNAFVLHDHPEHCVRAWTTVHARIAAFAAPLDPARVLRVRAEDVLNDGGSTLRRIAAWLGVRGDDAAIDAMLHPERSPYATLGPAGASGGNDPRFLREPALRSVELPAAVDFPAAWKVARDVADRARELAAELGYAA
jgi:hypothetical protein